MIENWRDRPVTAGMLHDALMSSALFVDEHFSSYSEGGSVAAIKAMVRVGLMKTADSLRVSATSHIERMSLR